MLVMGKRKYPESIETPESFRPSLCHFVKWTDDDREGGRRNVEKRRRNPLMKRGSRKPPEEKQRTNAVRRVQRVCPERQHSRQSQPLEIDSINIIQQ
jgi:hypothetical protein